MEILPLGRLTVLVVEDNAPMRELIGALLKAFKIGRVREAADGAAGLETIRREAPDIVICDWEMAPMDGIAFVRAVRTGPNSPNPYLPIIMLSAHSELSRVRAARDAGVNEFVVKPVSAKTLHDRFVEIVERPRPFVRSPGYFGPDRRRRTLPDYPGPFRRAGDAKREEVVLD